jgi:hypothetical protein
MSQEYTNSRKQRRASRANRNRPVLVTSTETNESTQANGNTATEQPSAAIATETPLTTDSQPETKTAPTTATAPAPASRARRLPGFFSTVGKKEEGIQEDKTSIAQARIARATRAKGITGTTNKVEAVTPESTEKSDKRATTTQSTEKTTSRPTSRNSTNRPTTFKTRYIIGMVVYLLAAQLIGELITSTFTAYKIDSVLLQFPLFGSVAVIRTSTLIYLAILIILLAVLARFDLLPRSLGAMTNTQTGRSSSSNSSSNKSESRKLPTVRQGVQGADDDLYQQYRANQRKRK